MANLTREDAAARAELIEVHAYRVRLDLTGADRAEVTTFDSEVSIDFGCRTPGASTFVDVAAEQVHEVRLNGVELDASVTGSRIELPALAESNTITVRATMAYSHDGQGLHRAHDPGDGRYYVYGHLFLDAAPRVFACFDQPDLKAPFEVEVSAPSGWTVLGNGGATPTDGTTWHLERTPPLATYFVTVCAGPYVSVTDVHDGITLGLHARASLAGPLHAQAGQLLEVTRTGLDNYHRLFDIRYPFGQYHQVFVPEFNAGAMENPGCVTFRDSVLFRGAATDDQILARSNTIAHELAHMWFGDLVTMKWWDDLWLNESFAEYMAHRTIAEAADAPEVWVDSTMARKVWGYAAERAPSTHPVAGASAPDADTALQNFDGISYAKGAAVLRQLIAYIGDEAFIAGIRQYLTRHAFGNAALTDFLAAMEEASGRDLHDWARHWLGTAGLDTISADLTDTGVLVSSHPPEQYPAQRPHTLDVAVWADGRQIGHTPVTLDAQQVQVEMALDGSAAVVVPNAGDLTWARVRLDDASIAALPAQLARIEDAQHRAVIWTALIDAVALTELDPRQFIEIFLAAWPVEESASMLSRVGDFVVNRLLPEYLPGSDADNAAAAVGNAADQRLGSANPGSSQAWAAARVVVEAGADLPRLSAWLRGDGLPAGLAGDADFRWAVTKSLARAGAIGVEQIEEVYRADTSMQGRLGVLAARAALPSATEKQWAWQQLVGQNDRSNYERNAIASTFWLSGEPEQRRSYVERYLTEVPAMSEYVGQDALARLAQLAYPRTVVEETTEQATAERLSAAGLSPAVRRAMVDQHSVLREVLASRKAFGGVRTQGAGQG